MGVEYRVRPNSSFSPEATCSLKAFTEATRFLRSVDGAADLPQSRPEGAAPGNQLADGLAEVVQLVAAG